MDDIWANKTGKEKNLFVLEPFLTCGSSCNIKRKRSTNLGYCFSVGSHLDILK
jgi:hypothetical protein